jgi:hypothetical protein
MTRSNYLTLIGYFDDIKEKKNVWTVIQALVYTIQNTSFQIRTNAIIQVAEMAIHGVADDSWCLYQVGETSKRLGLFLRVKDKVYELGFQHWPLIIWLFILRARTNTAVFSENEQKISFTIEKSPLFSVDSQIQFSLLQVIKEEYHSEILMITNLMLLWHQENESIRLFFFKQLWELDHA